MAENNAKHDGIHPLPAPAESAVGRTGLAMTLLAAILGWMFDGFEMGLFPLGARPALKELMGPQAATHIGTWFSAIIAGFLVGAAFGGVLFGWLGDRIGRVRAMVWSVATYAVFSGLCAFVTEPWHLAALRLIASLGMGGEWSLGVALVMETWPRKYNTLLAALIGAAANVGFLITALMGYALTRVIGDLGQIFLSAGLPQSWVDRLLANSGWRLLLLMGAMPALLTFLIRIFVPESKRWQEASKGKAQNRIRDIFQGGLAKPALLGSVLCTIGLLGNWGTVQWIPAWADQLSHQMPVAKSWAQIASSLGAIVGTILGAYTAAWTNRRWAYFLLCGFSLIFCAILFRINIEFGNTFLILVFIVSGCSASFFGWLPLYMPELFPTRIRATGQGFAFNSGRILAAAGTLAGGSLLNYFQEDYARMCSVISLIYAAGLLVIWFCPETKNKPLPE